MLHYERNITTYRLLVGMGPTARGLLILFCTLLGLAAKLLHWDPAVWVGCAVLSGITLLAHVLCDFWD